MYKLILSPIGHDLQLRGCNSLGLSLAIEHTLIISPYTVPIKDWKYMDQRNLVVTLNLQAKTQHFMSVQGKTVTENSGKL